MFSNRKEAGSILAVELTRLDLPNRDTTVLAVPRGGVVVGREVADALATTLDVVITRKIGAPGNAELAIGAVSFDGEVIMDAEIVSSLGVSKEYVKAEAERQSAEIRRRTEAYAGKGSPPRVSGKTVVIVDDGIATGSTMRAAIESVKRRRPKQVIVAVPVGPPESIEFLKKIADRVISVRTPEPFYAIGQFYEEFEQVTDETVKNLLVHPSLRG